MSQLYNARDLRSNPTGPERFMWNLLRTRRLAGWKFRRQAPIGPYIADFFCPDAKLVVELDGGQHQSQSKYDDDRTRWLEEQGYQVLRFWNNEVLGQSDAVLQTILKALSPSNDP